jgi:hypothetical protein
VRPPNPSASPRPPSSNGSSTTSTPAFTRALAARELLRRLFKDGRVVLEPQPDGVYLARTEVLPLLLLSEGVRDHAGPRLLPGAAVSVRLEMRLIA